jgi:hypothetical protein
MQIARLVLHRPVGRYSGGAPLRPLGAPLPPPPPPPVNLTTRLFPLGLPLTALLWSFVLGFAVGYLLGELLLKPWLASLQPRDLRTVPPLGELDPSGGGEDPTNWAVPNSPLPPSLQPDQAPEWWPTGSIGTLGDLRTNIGVTLDYVTDVGGTGTNIQTGSIPISTYAINPDGIEVETIGDNVYVYAKYPDGSRGSLQADGTGIYQTTWTVTTTFAPAYADDPGRTIPAYPAQDRPRVTPAPGPLRRPDIRPQPVEAPQPATVPQTLPVRTPASPTLPGRPAIPGTIPNRPPTPQPPANPATTPRPGLVPIPLLPNGQPAPDIAAPPQLWPPNLEVPWPTADPIGQTAAQPRPDLASIARELGRQEQKLAQLGAGKGGPDLGKLLEQIADLLPDPPAYSFPAGGYQLAPICDRDAMGNLLDPLESNWPAGSGELAELRYKVDALAELMQFAKIWKQPICSPERSAPMGAPVTVTFEEVPLED